MSLINTALQAASVLMNSQNIQRQDEREYDRSLTALEVEKIRQEGQLKMAYMTQEFQKNSRWEEANLRKIDQSQYQKDEYILRAHQQRLERMKAHYYTPDEWVKWCLPNAPAPFVIISLNPQQEHNPFKAEAVRIAPFSRIADRLKQRNTEYVNRLFSVITTQEGFSSDDEVLHFYNRELNCPCIVIYGEFTGSSFVVNALYAGMEQNQIKFDKDRPSSLGAKVVRVWEVSYKTIDTLKQTYAQKGDKYGWLEALETYTETHVGLFVQLMLDNLFSYSPRHVYEIKAPLFLQEKEEELTRLGIWEALKTSLLERYEILKGRQELDFKISEKQRGEFIKFKEGSLKMLSDTNWGFYDENGHFCTPFFLDQFRRFSSNAIKCRGENGRFGFISNLGELIIPFEYDDADDMRENYAAVRNKGLWGLLRFNSQEAVSFSFKYMRSPIQGKVIFSTNKGVGLMDTNGKFYFEPRFGAITELKDNFFIGTCLSDIDKAGIYDVNGEEILPPIFFSAKSKNLGNGFFILTETGSDKQYIFNAFSRNIIDLKNKVFQSIFGVVFSFKSHMIDIEYDSEFKNGFAIIKLIAPALNYHNPPTPKIGFVMLTSNEYLYHIYHSNWLGLDDVKLSENILTCTTDRVPIEYGLSRNLKAFFKISEVIKNDTIELPASRFEQVYLSKFSEGLAIKMDNHRMGFINNATKEVIECQYEYCSDFSEDLAVVGKAGKFGYINKMNDVIVPYTFDYADKFQNECAIVAFSDKELPNIFKKPLWAIINKEGKILVM